MISRQFTLLLCMLAGLAISCVVLGTVDARGHSLQTQLAVSVAAWCIFAAMLVFAPPQHRAAAVIMMLVATDFECFGSLLCGFYIYRLHNLPLYVPAGHGIFYLVARRALDSRELRSVGPHIIRFVLVGSGVWVCASLVLPPHSDVEGALWWPILAYCLCRRRNALMYAVTFVLTMALEYLGTGLGAWHWSATLPGTMLPSGNPPSACAAGYCLLDASAMRVLRLYKALRGSDITDLNQTVAAHSWPDTGLMPVASQVNRA